MCSFRVPSHSRWSSNSRPSLPSPVPSTSSRSVVLDWTIQDCPLLVGVCSWLAVCCTSSLAQGGGRRVGGGERMGDYIGQAQIQNGVGHTDKNMQTIIKVSTWHAAWNKKAYELPWEWSMVRSEYRLRWLELNVHFIYIYIYMCLGVNMDYYDWIWM